MKRDTRDTVDIVGELVGIIEEFGYEHELREGREYLCKVSLGWARSPDPVVAFARAVKHAGYLGINPSARFWECDSDTRVDDVGRMTWKRDRDEPTRLDLVIDITPDIRSAWQEYVDALPRVAYLALHED